MKLQVLSGKMERNKLTKEPERKSCVKCQRGYQYIKEEALKTMTIREMSLMLEKTDHYDYKELSISLVYCFYCHDELVKEENYTRLLHQLGNTKEEQRQKFKQFHKSQRTRWITFERKLPIDICLNCGIKTETRATRAGFSFCSEQCREEDREQSIFVQHKEDFEYDTHQYFVQIGTKTLLG